MKIIKQEKTGNKCKFEIEIDFSEFKNAREEIISSYSKDMKIPGFRPGKAPKNLIEKSLEPEVLKDHAAQHLISNNYQKLISDAKIDPVDYPSVNIIKLNDNEPFVFSLEVEVYPEVKLGKYKGIKAEKKPTDVADNEVLQVLGNLQDRYARFIPVPPEEGAAENDFVDLEVQSEAEGSAIKTWPRDIKGYPIGKGYISPDFDPNIIGMKLNEEKSFTVDFKKDHQLSEIAGKTVSFKVVVKKILRKELLALDDEFAKTVSSYGTLLELKEEVRKNLELDKKDQSEADFKNALINGASEEAVVEIPEALVRTEIEVMLEELGDSLSRSNLTLKDYLQSLKKTEDDLKQELKTPALVRAKGKVVLKKIAEAEKLEVAAHDIDTEIALMAQQSGKSSEEYKKSLGRGGLAYITDYLLRRKALDFLSTHAKIS